MKRVSIFKKAPWKCMAMLILLGASSSLVSAQSVYKWKDANGKWAYGSQPPDSVQKVEKLSTSSGPKALKEGEAAPGVSLANDKAKKLFPVTLFASGACAVQCDKAKAFLNERQIPFSLKDPGKPENFEEFKKASPASMAPAIVIGDKPLVGFSEAAWADALESVGYSRDPVAKK